MLTDGRTTVHTNGQMDRRKLYTPRHTLYAGHIKNQVLFENQYVCLRGNDLKINKYAEEEISNNYSKICFIDIRKSKVL